MKYYNIIDQHGIEILDELGDYISTKLQSDEIIIEYYSDFILNRSYNLTILVKYDIYEDSRRIIIYFTKDETMIINEVSEMVKKDIKKRAETYLEYIHRKKVINGLL